MKLLSLHPNITVHVENVVSPPTPLAHKKYESVAAINFFDRILVNFYHCFSGVAQVCRDAAER